MTLTTNVSPGFVSRDTIDCSAVTICAAAYTGSTDRCGIPACPAFPITRSSKKSAPERNGPGTATTVPYGAIDSTCATSTMSTPSIAPSAIIRSAPARISSAGWKQNRTVPPSSSLSSVSTVEAPSAAATCTSCPQACITPGVRDANPWSTVSVIGSASMSARISSTGPPSGPERSASTPVPPAPSWGVMPSSRRCSAAIDAVRSSANASSG